MFSLLSLSTLVVADSAIAERLSEAHRLSDVQPGSLAELVEQAALDEVFDEGRNRRSETGCSATLYENADYSGRSYTMKRCSSWWSHGKKCSNNAHSSCAWTGGFMNDEVSAIEVNGHGCKLLVSEHAHGEGAQRVFYGDTRHSKPLAGVNVPGKSTDLGDNTITAIKLSGCHSVVQKRDHLAGFKDIGMGYCGARDQAYYNPKIGATSADRSRMTPERCAELCSLDAGCWFFTTRPALSDFPCLLQGSEACSFWGSSDYGGIHTYKKKSDVCNELEVWGLREGREGGSSCNGKYRRSRKTEWRGPGDCKIEYETQHGDGSSNWAYTQLGNSGTAKWVIKGNGHHRFFSEAGFSACPPTDGWVARKHYGEGVPFVVAVKAPCRVKSVDHSSKTTGKYFNFDWADLETAMSADLDNLERARIASTLSVKQCRGGVELYTGAVRVWNNRNGGSSADSHGRREPGDRAWDSQWQVGDRIVSPFAPCPK